MSTDLEKNLKHLCAERSSVAKVCREIGINHQQFSKYLTGRSKPSAHNLRKIAKFFGLEDGDLLGDHDSLVRAQRLKTSSLAARRDDPLAHAFPGDFAKLKPFLGAYQVYFRAPVADNGIVVNAAFLDARNGMVYSRLVEALKDRSKRQRRWTRCDGKVSYQDGRLFVVDHERHSEKALSMYILTTRPRQKQDYLFGSMCYLASLPRRLPYASKVVWKKVGAYRSVRDLFDTCGLYSADSLTLDPVIRTYLATGFEE